MSGRIEGKLFPLHELIPLALYEADRWVVENGWLESTDMNYKMVRSTIDKSDSSIEMDYIHYTPQGLATFFNTSSNIITNEFRDNKKTMNEIIEIKKGIKPVMVTEEGNKVVAYKQSAYHLKHSLKKQIKLEQRKNDSCD